MPGRSLPSANRYARAIFEIALGAGSIDAWGDDLTSMAVACGNADFLAFLEAPGVTAEEKAQAVRGVLPDISDGAHNMLSRLIARRAATLLPRIRSRYQELVDAERGVRRVRVATAVPLTDAERSRVVGELGRTLDGGIVLTETVDPSLLGGMLVRVGDRVLDGSVKGRLASLRRSLARGAAQ